MLERISTIRTFLSYALFAFPIIPSPYGSWVIAAWALVSLPGVAQGIIQKRTHWVGLAAILALPFLAVCIRTILDFTPATAQLIERYHSFWIFPLCWLGHPQSISKNMLQRYLQIFIVSTLTLSVVITVGIAWNGFLAPYDAAHDWGFRFRNEWNSASGVHPSYASLWLGLAALGSPFAFKNRYLQGLAVGSCLVFISLLGARLPFIGICCAALWVVYRSRPTIFKNLKWQGYVAALGILILLFIPVLGSRWKEIITSEASRENTLDVRKAIYNCNTEQFLNHPWIGQSPEDINAYRTYCYILSGDEAAQRFLYNAHNQWLEWGLLFGISGILLGIIWWLAPIIWAKGQIPLYEGLMIMTAISALGESLLMRQAGIVFICLWASVFLKYSINQTATLVKKPS